MFRFASTKNPIQPPAITIKDIAAAKAEEVWSDVTVYVRERRANGIERSGANG